MKKFLWKPAALFLSIVVAIVLIISASLKADNNYKATYTEAIQRPGYEPAPALVKVEISPATALEKSKKQNKVWVIAAWVLVAIAAGWILLVTNDIVVFGENSTGANYIMGALCAAALGCFIAAYSAAFASSYYDISPQLYEAIKDKPEELRKLFIK